MPRRLAALLVLLAGSSLLLAQDETLTSGPKVGSTLRAPFDAYNVNGKAKGRQHCIVCEFALSPSVLIFAKEPAEGKDGPLNDLLKKLDELIEADVERPLNAAVVFLSPAARSAATEAEPIDDAAKLAEEATAREALMTRLGKRAESLKHVIVAAYPPQGPKTFDVNPKAEVTAVVYDRLKVKATYAFAEEKLQADDVEAIAKKVRDVVAANKKR